MVPLRVAAPRSPVCEDPSTDAHRRTRARRERRIKLLLHNSARAALCTPPPGLVLSAVTNEIKCNESVLAVAAEKAPSVVPTQLAGSLIRSDKAIQCHLADQREVVRVMKLIDGIKTRDEQIKQLVSRSGGSVDGDSYGNNGSNYAVPIGKVVSEGGPPPLRGTVGQVSSSRRRVCRVMSRSVNWLAVVVAVWKATLMATT